MMFTVTCQGNRQTFFLFVFPLTDREAVLLAAHIHTVKRPEPKLADFLSGTRFNLLAVSCYIKNFKY